MAIQPLYVPGHSLPLSKKLPVTILFIKCPSINWHKGGKMVSNFFISKLTIYLTHAVILFY